MVDQAHVNPPGGSRPRSPVRGTADFLHDLLTLAELQWQLLVVDSREWLGRLLWPALGLAAGLALAASCLPLALIVLALTLVETTTLSLAQAFGVSLGMGLVLAAALVAAALWYVRRRLGFLERSRQEWQRNVQWAKETLQRVGRP